MVTSLEKTMGMGTMVKGPSNATWEEKRGLDRIVYSVPEVLDTHAHGTGAIRMICTFLFLVMILVICSLEPCLFWVSIPPCLAWANRQNLSKATNLLYTRYMPLPNLPLVTPVYKGCLMVYSYMS